MGYVEAGVVVFSQLYVFQELACRQSGEAILARHSLSAFTDNSNLLSISKAPLKHEYQLCLDRGVGASVTGAMTCTYVQHLGLDLCYSEPQAAFEEFILLPKGQLVLRYVA